jgi:flagellar biogenesis protein FliO
MELMWQMASVGFVFLLLAGALWWFKGKGMVQLGQPFPGGACTWPMNVANRLNLGPQHSLHLVRLGQRGLLVATYAGGCALIAEAPWDELAQERPPASQSALGKATRA